MFVKRLLVFCYLQLLVSKPARVELKAKTSTKLRPLVFLSSILLFTNQVLKFLASIICCSASVYALTFNTIANSGYCSISADVLRLYRSGNTSLPSQLTSCWYIHSTLQTHGKCNQDRFDNAVHLWKQFQNKLEHPILTAFLSSF